MKAFEMFAGLGRMAVSKRMDYWILKDPATGRKVYLPKVRGSDRALSRTFPRAAQAVDYRDRVLHRYWLMKERAHAAT